MNGSMMYDGFCNDIKLNISVENISINTIL